MADKKYQEYVNELFAPLVRAAGRSPASLYTQDIPDERKVEQFGRFSALDFDKSRVVPLPGGGFLALGKEMDNELLLLSAPSLNDIELQSLEAQCLSDLDMEAIEFDEAMLLVAAKQLSGFLRLKPTFRRERDARDILDLAYEPDYTGHSVYDILGYYNEVHAFRIEADNAHFEAEASSLALSMLSSQRSLRSPIIDEVTGDRIASLRGKTGCRDGDLFQALTANQWRYAFLDIYRCVESLYFFPWMKRVRERFALTTDIFYIRDKIRTDLDWQSKEDKSIARLFELIDVANLDMAKDRGANFFDLDPSNASRSAYASKVYSARNMAVHFEDRHLPGASAPSSEVYQELCMFLCDFLFEFDKIYSVEFPS